MCVCRHWYLFTYVYFYNPSETEVPQLFTTPPTTTMKTTQHSTAMRLGCGGMVWYGTWSCAGTRHSLVGEATKSEKKLVP
jgi:hypothetical protein